MGRSGDTMIPADVENVEVLPGTDNILKETEMLRKCLQDGYLSFKKCKLKRHHIKIISSRLWILWISYLVPEIAKSRPKCPISAVFVEKVQVLPGTDNTTGRSRSDKQTRRCTTSPIR